MDTKTITVELTQDQYDKVKILKDNSITVGEAIDFLFDAQENIADIKIKEAEKRKEMLTSELEEIDKEISMFKKLKDETINPEEKQRILEKEYSFDDTYEIEVQRAKTNISWAKDFFKF